MFLSKHGLNWYTMVSMRLVLLFAMTYLFSRVLVRFGGHVDLLRLTIQKSRGSGAKTLLGLMLLTFALSACIPNIVTILAVLPLIRQLIPETHSSHRRLTTTFVLGVIYAANIGGSASLVGSPANGLLLLVGAQFDVPEIHQLNFLNWLAFGAPMSLILLIIAWHILRLFDSKALTETLVDLCLPPKQHPEDRRRGKQLLTLGVFGMITASAVAPYMTDLPILWGTISLFDCICAFAAIAYAGLVFHIRFPSTGERIIRLEDLHRDVSKRGVLYLIVFGGLAVGLGHWGVLTWALDVLSSHLPNTIEFSDALVLVVIVTIFATEALSNTATALAMWTFAAALSQAGAFSPFWLFLGIALASTSAFMSPLATPATALAFGSVPGVSLKRMMVSGLLLNVIAALWLLLSLKYWIPIVLGI